MSESCDEIPASFEGKINILRRWRWAIESLCGERPPDELIDASSVKIQEWVSTKIPDGISSTEVANAAIKIAFADE